MARKTFSNAEKTQIMQLLNEGFSYKDIRARFDVSEWTLARWEKQAHNAKHPAEINPLLAAMAKGNDLSKFTDKIITKMQPREIYEFLRLLNIKAILHIEQEIKINL